MNLMNEYIRVRFWLKSLDGCHPIYYEIDSKTNILSCTKYYPYYNLLEDLHFSIKNLALKKFQEKSQTVLACHIFNIPVTKSYVVK